MRFAFILLLAVFATLTAFMASAADGEANTAGKTQAIQNSGASALAEARELYRKGEYKDAFELLRPERDPESLAFMAVICLDMGKVGDAEDILKQAIAKHAAHPALLLARSRLRRETGDPAAAAADLRAILETDPEEISDGDTRLRARLNLAELYDEIGWRDGMLDAVDPFFDLYAAVEDNDDLTAAQAYCIGMGAVLAGDFQNGIKVVALAQKKDRDDVRPTVRVGEIFAGKYQYADAKNEFEDALRRNPRHPDAHAGLAGVFFFSRDFDEVRKHAAKALSVNPHHPEALLLQGGIAFVEEKPDEALAKCDAVLKTYPLHPEALRFRAALQAATDDDAGFAETRKRLLALPEKAGLDAYAREQAESVLLSRLYEDAASLLLGVYRLEDATAYAKKAVEADPENSGAQAQYGICLMRWGREDEAEPVLRQAFRLDPYNVWVSNLRKLLKRRDQYEEFDTDRFRVVLYKKDDPILRDYIADLADQQLARCEKLYGFKVPRRTRLAVLKSHSDFSARVTGLPRMDATGATFGPFVALVSPGDWVRRGRSLNWRSVMLHELAHVVTVTASDYRIPRWLTEGMSVHAEGWIDPSWDAPLATLLDRGPPSLADFNRHFHRPEHVWEVPAAYMAAGLFVRWFAEDFGEEKLPALVKGYGDGKSTEQVFREVSGKSLDELEAWYHARLGEYAKTLGAPVLGDPQKLKELEEAHAAAPDDSATTLRLLRTYAMVGHPKTKETAQALVDAALAESDKAAKTDRPAEAKRSLCLAARLLATEAYAREDWSTVEVLLRIAGECPTEGARVAFLRGLLKEKQGEDTAALVAYREALELYPRFTQKLGPLGSPYRSLFQALMAKEQREEAAEVLARYCSIQRDDAESLRNLAKLQTELEWFDKALATWERVLAADPYRRADHLAFAELLEKAGRKEDAARERRIAAACPEPEPEKESEAQAADTGQADDGAEHGANEVEDDDAGEETE